MSAIIDRIAMPEGEMNLIKIRGRFGIALAALGADRMILDMKGLLILNGGGYSISSLAESMGVPRRTVGYKVNQCVQWGAMTRLNGGVYITQEGAEMFRKTQREAYEIAMGKRVGFDPAFVDIITKMLAGKIDADRAKTISFPDDISAERL